MQNTSERRPDEGGWIQRMAEEQKLWLDEELEKLPSVVAFEYAHLRELCRENCPYGVMLQIKDVFECVLKYQILLICAWADSRKLRGFEEKIGCNLTSRGLSLGTWHWLGHEVITYFRNDPAAACPQVMLTTLNTIRREFESSKLIKWRNEMIGHGALMFSSDEDFREDIRRMLTSLKGMLVKAGPGLCCQQLYADGAALRGPGLAHEIQADGSLFCRLNDDAESGFSVDPYISLRPGKKGNGIFFFDHQKSLMSQLQCYPSGRRRNEQVSRFLELQETLEGKKWLRQAEAGSKYANEEEEDALDQALASRKLLPPGHIVEWLAGQVREYTGGVFLLRMSRGMGKTTFSEALNGLYESPLTIAQGLAVRTYHLTRTQLIHGVSFEQNVEMLWSRGFDGHIWTRAPRISDLGRKESPAKALMKFLQEALAYSRIHYAADKVMLVLDGLDEIEDDAVWSYLPDPEEVPDNVYLFMTARDPELEELSPKTRERLLNLKVTQELRITPESDANRRFLREYISCHHLPGISEERQELLMSLSEYRILNLSMYCKLIQGGYDYSELPHAEQLISYYLQALAGRYTARETVKMRELLAILAVFGEREPLSVESLAGMWNGGCVNVDLLGKLNDLGPMLTIERGYSVGGVRYTSKNHYRIANPGIAQALRGQLDELPDVAEDQLKNAMFAVIRACSRHGQEPEWPFETEEIFRWEKMDNTIERRRERNYGSGEAETDVLIVLAYFADALSCVREEKRPDILDMLRQMLKVWAKYARALKKDNVQVFHYLQSAAMQFRSLLHPKESVEDACAVYEINSLLAGFCKVWEYETLQLKALNEEAFECLLFMRENGAIHHQWHYAAWCMRGSEFFRRAVGAELKRFEESASERKYAALAFAIYAFLNMNMGWWPAEEDGFPLFGSIRKLADSTEEARLIACAALCVINYRRIPDLHEAADALGYLIRALREKETDNRVLCDFYSARLRLIRCLLQAEGGPEVWAEMDEVLSWYEELAGRPESERYYLTRNLWELHACSDPDILDFGADDIFENAPDGRPRQDWEQLFGEITERWREQWLNREGAAVRVDRDEYDRRAGESGFDRTMRWIRGLKYEGGDSVPDFYACTRGIEELMKEGQVTEALVCADAAMAFLKELKPERELISKWTELYRVLSEYKDSTTDWDENMPFPLYGELSECEERPAEVDDRILEIARAHYQNVRYLDSRGELLLQSDMVDALLMLAAFEARRCAGERRWVHLAAQAMQLQEKLRNTYYKNIGMHFPERYSDSGLHRHIINAWVDAGETDAAADYADNVIRIQKRPDIEFDGFTKEMLRVLWDALTKKGYGERAEADALAHYERAEALVLEKFSREPEEGSDWDMELKRAADFLLHYARMADKVFDRKDKPAKARRAAFLHRFFTMLWENKPVLEKLNDRYYILADWIRFMLREMTSRLPDLLLHSKIVLGTETIHRKELLLWRRREKELRDGRLPIIP